MKPNLIVETQQLDSILLVYILISATQTNRVQARVFLLDGFESSEKLKLKQIKVLYELKIDLFKYFTG